MMFTCDGLFQRTKGSVCPWYRLL